MDNLIRFQDGTTYKEIYLRNSEDAQKILGKFHDQGKPALCLCNEEAEIKLSIKKRNKYFLAIYPNTGPLHNSSCAHYQKPPEVLTGAAQLTENARKEANGKVYISCKVGLTRRENDAPDEDKTADQEEDLTVTEKIERKKHRRVALTDVFLEFWLGSQLNQWMPAYRNSRYWGSVRTRLSNFTSNVFLNRLPLSQILYIPFVYKKEKEAELNSLKSKFFSKWEGVKNKDFLVIGELRAIDETPKGYGVKLVHENYVFFLSSEMYEQLTKRFQLALEIHENNLLDKESPSGRILVIMSCNMGSRFITIKSISLITATMEYIPVLNKYELVVAKRLVAQNRTFYRPAKASVHDHDVPDFVLLDTGKETVIGVVDDHQEEFDEYYSGKRIGLESLDYPVWQWKTHEEDEMPQFPPIAAE